MATIGYAISCEEHSPRDILQHAKEAEAAGFPFAMISDHFHPWISRQGHSPFVWGVLGGLAQVTRHMRFGTGVTCPTIRIHPAIIAQAAATAASMLPGRFFLGVGTGEQLNEHILGDRWPPHDVRAELLEEAVGVIRLLWQGGDQTHRGRYFTVEHARVYTLPEELPPIMVAASGPRAAELAGRIGDGLINTSPDADVRKTFERAGGRRKPRYGQLTVCWAKRVAQARKTALEQWPNAALPGELGQELPTPAHFEQAAQLVTEDTIAEQVVCGPDAQKHIAKLQEFVDAGYDHVAVHQVGPDQSGFFDFYAREVLPHFH